MPPLLAGMMGGRFDVTPMPVMTSNTTPAGYVASASAETYGAAWQAFDSVLTSPNQFWGSNPGVGGWLQIQFPGPRRVIGYAITTRSDSGADSQTATAWQLQGSNDGTVFHTLDTRTGQTGWTPGQTRSYAFSNYRGFLIYRLAITASPNPTIAIVCNLRFVFAS